MMSKEKRRVPKLRFPGFTEDWEQRKLGDFYTFKNGLNKEKVYFGYGDSIVNFIDVFHNRQIYSSTLKGKVCVNKKELENYKVKEGDFFFTRTSENIEEIGFPAVVMEPMERVVFSGFVLRGRAEKYDPLVNIFKSYIFFTDNFRSEMKKKSSMTTRALTSGTALKEMYFSYPRDLEEQNKIGEILLRLDKIITLHQRKLDNLKLKKKALLQKIFPKNGERYPELRFPGFTDAWEQRKFKDLFKERREKTIKENEETLLSCAITGIYLNSELFSHFRGSSTIGYLKIKKYDLILSAQNLHLGNANINLFFEKGMISPAYKVFELKSIDPYFVNAWVKQDATKNFFLKATTEGASQCRKNIEWDVLLNQEIAVPNNLEQKTIGKFINKFDRIITLHQRKLEHLQLQKKALLQQMFV